MKLEDQVISLELSKRLKELGVKQESYFSYNWFSQKKHLSNEWYEPRVVLKSEAEINDDALWEERYEEISSAFTVAELGEMLPPFIKSSKHSGIAGGWFCHLDTNEPNIPGVKTERKEIMADSEADARAKMLIYLIENKLIKI